LAVICWKITENLVKRNISEKINKIDRGIKLTDILEILCGAEKIFRRFALIPVIVLSLAACEGATVPEMETYGDQTVDPTKRETVFGDSKGFGLGGDDKPKQAPASGIGVNAFLWRATLDTLSVWPITSADPFGGVIITDWYAPPQTPTERFKLNVFILDRALRADGVRVSVFRQKLAANNQWGTAPVQAATATKLENAILMRARQFRSQTTQ